MGAQESEPVVEFIYAFHKGEPIAFGLGSFDDLAEAEAIKQEVNGSSSPDSRGDSISPGAKAFVMQHAHNSGMTDAAEAILEHYDQKIEYARQAFVNQLRGE